MTGRSLKTEYAVGHRREHTGGHRSIVTNAPECIVLHRFPPKRPYLVVTPCIHYTYLMHHRAPSAHIAVHRSPILIVLPVG